MTPPDLAVHLRQEALRRGIQPSYFDMNGQEHVAPVAVLERLIDAYGPVVEEDGAPPRVIPADLAPGFSLPVRLEHSDRFLLHDAHVPLPAGYHTVEWREHRRPLLAVPPRMWSPPGAQRIAGLAIALYGLTSSRNWGVGDFRDLRQLISWSARALGAQFVALNPLHAIHNREPYNISPYLPLSAYFRNFLYLDIESFPEFARPEVASAFGNATLQAELDHLRRSPFVEYGRVAEIKERFLRLAFRVRDREFDRELESFCSEGGQLLADYALFSALDEHFRRTRPGTWLWTEWPIEYQGPRSPACERFAREHEEELRFHCWVQFRIERQLAGLQQHALDCGMSVGLYHDLALSTDRFGFDRWANPSYFVEGCRVGAPPDAFSPEGQDWSFPPVKTPVAARDGYSLFAEGIRRNAVPGGALRMDHVMRLFRLFWIPDGYTPREGTYVQEPWRDLLGVLAIESHRRRFQVVGEDLGTVTPEMRQALEASGILGYRILFFERDNEGFLSPDRYSPQAVASVSTHDLPTLAGFWGGMDIDARRDAGLLPNEASWRAQWMDRRRDKQALLDSLHEFGFLPAAFARDADAISPVSFEVRQAALRLLAETRCQWLAINQEDLTGETLQQNLPGSTSEYPNWKRKMQVTVEDLDSLDVSWLREILARSGRL